MGEQHFYTLAEMPVCRCGMPLREKGMVRRIIHSNARRGPSRGMERSSITRCSLTCHNCGRDNIVEYLWINKWEPSSPRNVPRMGYQLKPGDDPEAVFGALLEAREQAPQQLAPKGAVPMDIAPPTAEQAELAQDWLRRIREAEGWA